TGPDGRKLSKTNAAEPLAVTPSAVRDNLAIAAAALGLDPAVMRRSAPAAALVHWSEAWRDRYPLPTPPGEGRSGD
ncbi:MAG: hypothetical protein V2J10_06730, partial [Wenzhouxiangella sp.]|nr:hypothetical protein [Wenzhouxiangella sp.]